MTRGIRRRTPSTAVAARPTAFVSMGGLAGEKVARARLVSAAFPGGG